MNIKKFFTKEMKKIFNDNNIPASFNPVVQRNIKNNDVDYQVNGIIRLKNLNLLSVKQLVEKITDSLKNYNIYQKIYAHKSGFVNIRLKSSWLCEHANKMFNLKNFNFEKNKIQTIVVDYSSPNIAKELHIGHLRSTILGDVTARVMKFLGYTVIRQNHIGDWGTQFGILITQLKSQEKISIDNIESIYQKAYLKYKNNPDFLEKTEKNVVKLQNKNAKCIKIWKLLVKRTIQKNQLIYKKLNVLLKPSDIRGESFYNFMLPEIIADLKKKKIAVKDNGRVIVYLNNFKNRQGEKMGVVIQKKNKAYLYTTTDIACLKFRGHVLKANRIIYYVDSRQKQHLLQVWEIAKKANYVSRKMLLEHHSFGMILNKNKKPFQTRYGETIKLMDLLTEGISRAKKIIEKKNKNLTDKEITEIAENIGIGAIKYFDLSKNRASDYIFDWDQMLSLEGNTAPYIQYAYTRIQSVIKKAILPHAMDSYKINIFTIFERKLIMTILQFEETVHILEKKGTPHLMCNYLYELAGKFSNFYENCSILFVRETHIKVSRIKLSILTAKIIKKGLYLLGINTVPVM
ncbi:arginine--tRNA ligase [Buchnera aphidicola]|uniref:arginine--tRNA ligase n=1 Tax=Buchnera aphidicola TaxID=9 RepID=UPI00094CD04C|nr:arginine--tRNA ligase [Buchnera aphidicola]